MKLLALLNLLTLVSKKNFCRFSVQSIKVKDQKKFKPWLEGFPLIFSLMRMHIWIPWPQNYKNTYLFVILVQRIMILCNFLIFEIKNSASSGKKVNVDISW